ncbi:MAG TPA: phosphotransferase [Thermoanaerobaculia bacterium]|nr:phosphotransferase [Thermoanaerobaculia bacterium]
MTTTTPNDLVYYLIERGLLAPASVVDGKLIVVEGARRNANFMVMRRDGTPYFVKCVQPASAGSAETLQREAVCYEWAASHPGLTGLRELMPRFFHNDPQRGILVLELFPGAQNISDVHRRAGAYPEEVARLIARAVARYQLATSSVFASLDRTNFRAQTPWVLSLHQSHSQFGQAGKQVATILQSYPDYGRALDRLRNQYHPNALIHGDMKFDNVLLLPSSEIRIIDWELSDAGEDLWDTGAVLQSYITACVLATQGTMAVTVEPVQPAMRAFWDEYVRARGIPEGQADAYLERCVAYAGARMLQTALETLVFSPGMTAHVALALQCSLNILRDSSAAVRDLLGVPARAYA